ncbi:MAG: hypothetical protein V6Z82_02545 [Flavobacteriales bacterium]
MKRAVSVKELKAMQFDGYPFKGPFYELVGSPSKGCVWLIWGESGNGKTSFLMQLSNYLAEYGKVMYNSLEEGIGQTLRLATIRNGLTGENSYPVQLQQESMTDLTVRLRKRRSANFVIIDSFQFAKLNALSFAFFCDEFKARGKNILFISHADGNKPMGRSANSARYYADIKIRIEGFKAFPISRFGGSQKPYVIWPEGAGEYWGVGEKSTKKTEL